MRIIIVCIFGIVCFLIGCMYSSWKFSRCLRAGKFKVKSTVYKVEKIEE